MEVLCTSTQSKGLVVFIVGPTASGKSSLGLKLCLLLGGELVNADAMQLYEGAPISTNKPTEEELLRVRHHLVGCQDPAAPVTVQDYVKMATTAIEDVHSRGRVAVVVGGTFFYVLALYFVDWIIEQDGVEGGEVDDLSLEERVALLQELDSAAASRIDPKDKRKVTRALKLAKSGVATQTELFERQKRRARYEHCNMIVLRAEGEAFEKRIELRVGEMMSRGMAQEAAALRRRMHGDGPVDCEHGIWQSIGLKEFLVCGDEDAAKRIAVATVRYAKKQWRFLRNTLCPMVDHVLVPFEEADRLCAGLARWVKEQEEQEGIVVVKKERIERSKEIERLDCCGKVRNKTNCVVLFSSLFLFS
jgi:tRNA dimethylallyltransferase